MKAREADFDQVYLLPPQIEDWIGPDHPARFIREVVDSLDLKELGFPVEVMPKGRPPYAAALLVRVWLYGYWERIRSTRKLEDACSNHMGFIWLCGMERPDHNTLWRFFRSNRKALRELFKQTVRVAGKLDLVGLVLQAVDGTKIQGACSGRGKFDRASLEKLLEKLDEQIEHLEEQIEESNEKEAASERGLPKELQNRQRLKEKVTEALGVIESEKTGHANPQDLEARRMGCDGRNRFGFNAQAVVDEKEQVIVACEVLNDATDVAHLVPMAKQARELTGEETTTLADGGYGSSANYLAAEDAGLDVICKLPSGSRNKEKKPYHASEFTYDETHDVFVCPQGRSIPFQRERMKDGKPVRTYRSVQVCAGCPVRDLCTKDRHGRTIELQYGHQALVRMRDKLEQRKDEIAQRSRIVEPVFGQIKQNQQFRRWTMHGLESCKAQWALHCSIWNLRKIYKQWRELNGGPKTTRMTNLRSLRLPQAA